MQENADRVLRFRRLAALLGTMPPQVDQVTLPPNSVSYMTGSVPVVRAVFDERAFFDFNSDTPRAEASPIFDLIAENMRRDVPDAALTVLGHTDAVGTDDYNLDLSARRAAKVIQELARRGVNPDQMSEVAIGKRQPIAPNASADGRARNRRVEFLVSSSIDANLAAVQQRVVPAAYLALADGRPTPPAKTSVAQVLRMAPSIREAANRPANPASVHLNNGMDLLGLGGLPLQKPVDQELLQKPTMPVADQTSLAGGPTLLTPEPVRPVKLLAPEPIHVKALGEAQSY